MITTEHSATNANTAVAANTTWLPPTPDPPGVATASVDWLVASLVGLAALLVHLYRLGSTSIWGDEAFSLDLVSQPWRTQLQYIWSREVNMTLYYLLLRGWLHVLSALGLPMNEALVRLPSVVFDVLSVVVVFLLGLRLWGRTVGIVAAALYLLNYLHLMMASEARAYSLELLLTIFAWYALVAALTVERGTARWWAAYSAAMVLAIYAHLFSALVLAAQLIALGALLYAPTEWRARVRGSLRPIAASLGVIGLAVLPLAVDVRAHGSSTVWEAPVASLKAVLSPLWHIGDQNLVYGLVVVSACGLAAWAVLSALLSRRGATRRPDDGAPLVSPLAPAPVIVLLCWAIAPILLSLVASLKRINLHLYGDYIVVAAPALCLLAAVGATALRRPAPRYAAVALLLLAALAGTRDYQTNMQRQDFRTVARWMGERYRAGDGLVCTSSSCATVMEYYLRAGVGPVRAAEPHFLGMYSWPRNEVQPVTIGALARYANARRRIFFVDAVLAGDPEDLKLRTQDIQKWLEQRYPALSQVSAPAYYGTITARLYVTNPKAHIGTQYSL